MRYYDKLILKDGRECVIRNTTSTDAYNVIVAFNRMQTETDYLLRYPEENDLTNTHMQACGVA